MAQNSPEQPEQEKEPRTISPVTFFGGKDSPYGEFAGPKDPAELDADLADFRPRTVPADEEIDENPKDSSAQEPADSSTESKPEQPEKTAPAEKDSGQAKERKAG